MKKNGSGKPFRKKTNPKNRNTSKNQKEIANVNNKPLARKLIFVQTPFSHSTLKLEQKNFKPQNHSLFRVISLFLHFLFQRDQNHYSNLTSKIMKMSEQISKTSPQYNSNSLNCKKTLPRVKNECWVIHATQLKLHKHSRFDDIWSNLLCGDCDDICLLVTKSCWRNKKHSRTSADLQFKEFSLTKQK